MTSDTVCLAVMDLKGFDRSQLSDFNVDEVNIMAANVNGCPPCHLVCSHSVKPLVFIERQPSNLWSNNSEDRPAHWQENKYRIQRETETSATRDPH